MSNIKVNLEPKTLGDVLCSLAFLDPNSDNFLNEVDIICKYFYLHTEITNSELDSSDLNLEEIEDIKRINTLITIGVESSGAKIKQIYEESI